MPDRRPALSAACKLANETGEAWVTWRGERLKLGKLPDDPRSYWEVHSGMTVVYVRSGRFRVTEIGMRKGSYPMIDLSAGGGNYKIQLKQLRSLVLERHPIQAA